MLETLMKLLVTEPDSFGKNFYPKNGLKIGFFGQVDWKRFCRGWSKMDETFWVMRLCLLFLKNKLVNWVDLLHVDKNSESIEVALIIFESLWLKMTVVF